MLRRVETRAVLSRVHDAGLLLLVAQTPFKRSHNVVRVVFLEAHLASLQLALVLRYALHVEMVLQLSIFESLLARLGKLVDLAVVALL